MTGGYSRTTSRYGILTRWPVPPVLPEDATMRTLRLSAAILLALIGAPIGRSAGAQASATAVHSELRACKCATDKTALQTALDLKHAGWTYIMPEPKSRQASWGNRDGRTTWFYGYWTNLKNHSTSSLQPVKDAKGEWIGDQKGMAAWRNGGSPRTPSRVEWLCSDSGGIEPS